MQCFTPCNLCNLEKLIRGSRASRGVRVAFFRVRFACCALAACLPVRACGLGFGFCAFALGFGFCACGLRFGVWVFGFAFWGLGFRACVLGFGFLGFAFWGLGFRVPVLGFGFGVLVVWVVPFPSYSMGGSSGPRAPPLRDSSLLSL